MARVQGGGKGGGGPLSGGAASSGKVESVRSTPCQARNPDKQPADSSSGAGIGLFVSRGGARTRRSVGAGFKPALLPSLEGHCGLFFTSTPDKPLIAAREFSDFCFFAKQPSKKCWVGYRIKSSEMVTVGRMPCSSRGQSYPQCPTSIPGYRNNFREWKAGTGVCLFDGARLSRNYPCIMQGITKTRVPAPAMQAASIQPRTT
jgi:hypothetical protein